jgi:hypothetical protein
MAEHNTDLNYGSFRNHQELMRAIGSRIQGKEPTIFFGTLDEWNALPDSEKAKYSTVKTPDEAGAKIVNVIEENNPNAASSGAVFNALTSKVDKVTGKELSSNDYTNEEKAKLADLENYDDTEIKSEIADLDEAKVDKVTGKGLSTNDYTTVEKTKLANIENGAQTNVIESIEVNGSAQPINNKTVAITVMTNAVDDLINYYKKSETYTQEEVNNLIGLIPKFSIKVVESLPVTDISYTTVYLLKTSETETDNLYTEYIYVKVSEQTSQWEKLGTQTLDLTNYVTTTDLNNALANYTTTTALNSLLSGKVDKDGNKVLSTNDFDNEAKNIVDNSLVVVSSSSSPVSTLDDRVKSLTIYGKSEVIDGEIKSAGEGWSTVDLGTLTWIYSIQYAVFSAQITDMTQGSYTIPANIQCARYQTKSHQILDIETIGIAVANNANIVYIKDPAYTDATAFKNSLNGVLLCYQLDDPIQGNAIAIKTDNSTGIDGTMATFTTGTPLYGISDTVRNAMNWDGSTGEVTNKCNKVRLADLMWTAYSTIYYAPISDKINNQNNTGICNSYNIINSNPTSAGEAIIFLTDNNSLALSKDTSTPYVYIRADNYSTLSDFVASLGDAELVYELATPTTTPLTQTENESLAGLKTYAPQTAVTINDNPDYSIEAYANTANGKSVQSLESKVKTGYEPKVISLTQAEYDALEAYEEDVFYNITDADPTGITIDSGYSATSENPVQNKVITASINSILSEAEIQAQINDRIYQGTDLTVKFATEISASPYSGDPWAWIKSRITAGDFTGIHICDYISITTTNNVTLNAQIAGINTYKKYGDSAVGSHIDFICKELWPTLHSVNPVNFNNGTAAENQPWLASDLYLYLNSLAGTAPSAAEIGGGEGTAVDYTEDGVYYYLPTQLKNVIIEKKFLLPGRYSASGLLSDDNSWAWKNIGKLWLPDECEVYGMPVWGGKGGYSLGGSALQYPLFAGNMNRLKFRNGSRDYWWLLSPYSGNSARWCFVDSGGNCDYYAASSSDIAAPVCFRVG